MSHVRVSLATEPVRRYLLQVIARSGTEPERLPAERNLSEQLGVSRVTVRRAIEELEHTQYIIRLPGRKGAFSNPRYSALAEHCIGLVVVQNYVGQVFSQFFGGVTEQLYANENNFNCSIYHNLRQSAQDTAFELHGAGYDVLVWHLQAEEDLKVIEYLLKQNYPVFTIGNPNYPQWKVPDQLGFALDFGDLCEKFASRLAASRCQFPLAYCHESLLPELRAKLAGYGIDLPGKAVLRGGKDLSERLPALLQRETDSVFFYQREYDLPKFLDIFHAVPRKQELLMSVSPGLMFTRFIHQHQEGIRFIQPDTKAFQQQCLALGREVGSAMCEFFRTGTRPTKKLLPFVDFSEIYPKQSL